MSSPITSTLGSRSIALPIASLIALAMVKRRLVTFTLISCGSNEHGVQCTQRIRISRGPRECESRIDGCLLFAIHARQTRRIDSGFNEPLAVDFYRIAVPQRSRFALRSIAFRVTHEMALQAHGLDLDQARTLPASGALDCLAARREDGIGILVGYEPTLHAIGRRTMRIPRDGGGTLLCD